MPRIFWNKLLGTATSANWNVTYRPAYWVLAFDPGVYLDQGGEHLTTALHDHCRLHGLEVMGQCGISEWAGSAKGELVRLPDMEGAS